MKKVKLEKKLDLNKQTVSTLQKDELQKVNGGAYSRISWCVCPD